MADKKIVYAAADGSMGDTTQEERDYYRAWSQNEIEDYYQDYDVTVSADETAQTVVTGDPEEHDEIMDFLNGLWDRCPWDWS